MSGLLLDTNVISEGTRSRPHPAVAEMMRARNDLWLSVVVVHEIEFGMAILDDIQRRDRLRASMSRILSDFTGRILPVNRQAAEIAASLRAQAHRAGRVLQPADALIAGTAVAHDLTLATRNTRDFADLDVDISNPWDD